VQIHTTQTTQTTHAMQAVCTRQTQGKRWLSSGWLKAGAGVLLGVALGGYGVAAGGEDAGARHTARPCWRADEKVMVVDRIEDEWVVLEVGQGQRVDIPLRVFPEGVGEGQRVSFVRVKEDGEERQRALERLQRLRGEGIEQIGQGAREALGRAPN
jgi:hypothetical protein